jgi:hypothetical protein
MIFLPRNRTPRAGGWRQLAPATYCHHRPSSPLAFFGGTNMMEPGTSIS